MGFVDDAKVNAQNTLDSIQQQSVDMANDIQLNADDAKAKIAQVADEARAAIEQKMNDLTQKADELKSL